MPLPLPLARSSLVPAPHPPLCCGRPACNPTEAGGRPAPRSVELPFPRDPGAIVGTERPDPLLAEDGLDLGRVHRTLQGLLDRAPQPLPHDLPPRHAATV